MHPSTHQRIVFLLLLQYFVLGRMAASMDMTEAMPHATVPGCGNGPGRAEALFLAVTLVLALGRGPWACLSARI